MSNDQISSRVSKNSNKHYYMFTPERLEGLEEVPDEKLMLLKFKFDDVAADISVDTVVTLPAKPMHFSVRENVTSDGINRNAFCLMIPMITLCFSLTSTAYKTW